MLAAALAEWAGVGPRARRQARRHPCGSATPLSGQRNGHHVGAHLFVFLGSPDGSKVRTGSRLSRWPEGLAFAEAPFDHRFAGHGLGQRGGNIDVVTRPDPRANVVPRVGHDLRSGSCQSSIAHQQRLRPGEIRVATYE